MTPEDVEAAVGRAIDRKLGQFYIDRETHYKDHAFIQSLRKWTDETKGTVLRAVVKIVTLAVIGLLLFGFIVWGKVNLGK